jgi:Domain of unknown function (DUF5666)/Putative binding domain, N-terminal
VTFRIDSNPDPTPRAGAVMVNDGRVDVTQQAAPCRFEVGRASDSVAAAGGASQIQVRTHDACSWNAASEDPWLSVMTTSGRGNGTVAVNVASNNGEARSGTVLVAGERVTITQSAMSAPPPPPAPSPTPVPTPTPPTPNPTPTPTPTPTPPTPPPTPPPPPEEDVELSGRAFLVVGSCPSLRFFVSGSLVTTNEQTKFRHGSCRDIENTDRVNVKGRRQTDGSVLATEVELDK